MKLEYTIIEGTIICSEDVCQIPFALVFSHKGRYYVETFLSNDINYFSRNRTINNFTISGKTEKGYSIVCTELSFNRYQSKNNKLNLTSWGFIQLIKPDRDGSVIETDRQKRIWFIELEGLKMKFGQHTEIEKYRGSKQIDKFANPHFDHTYCATVLNLKEGYGNFFMFKFINNPSNDNILLDLRKEEGYCTLFYNEYNKIKPALISFLSFMNGGQIIIRRELTGNFYIHKENGFDAQEVYNYSNSEDTEKQLSDYIPINYHHTQSREIFTNMFLRCFDKYYHLNKTLDLNSLVFSLNHSNLGFGLEETYFILITALEKVASRYTSCNLTSQKHLIDDDIFQEKIKAKLEEALEVLKISNATKTEWAIMKSRIGGLNNKRQTDTTQKLYDFLNFAKIPINNEVINLVDKERNRAVHEGIIGDTEKEKLNNLFKLDHILRDCILNMIGYRSHRERSYNYASFDELKEANPELPIEPLFTSITE